MLVTQSCPTLLDCSPSGSSVHGIPSLEDLPNPGIKPGSLALQADFLLSEPPEKPLLSRKEMASITGIIPGNQGWLVTGTVANMQVEKNIFHMVGSCEPLMGSKELTRCRLYFGLSWWLSGKESACNARDPGLIPGLGRSPGEGNGTPFQHSCLENPMDRGAWKATVRGITKS